jgi:uncharacterized Fe-S center protein
MDSAEVFFTDLRARPRKSLPDKVEGLLLAAGFGGLDLARKFVAVKVHFGEPGNLAFIRPNYAARVVSMVSGAGGRPFLTDTNSLYTGGRSNAVDHLAAASANGFNRLQTGCDVMIADGLKGLSSTEVEVGLKHTEKALIARAIAEADVVITLNHFKGHELTGIGGAIKNLGMGCASTGGKLFMHSSSKPKMVPDKCVSCGFCRESCPRQAIVWDADSKAMIVYDRCIGCGQCIAMCQYDAARAVLDESAAKAAEKIAEYALAAAMGKPCLHLSFITNVSPFCDCWGHNDAAIVADIGFACSSDPLALDKACTDIVNDAPVSPGSILDGRGLEPGDDKFSSVHPNTSWQAGLAYAEEIGLGTRSYELVKLD